MSEPTKADSKTTLREAEAKKPPQAMGRKRDHTRDQDIIEATVNILAEIGFDSMTMDMVANRAKAGKATLYRRWPSKAELVRDALIGMAQSSIELGHLPDTGSLRNDLLAVLKPYSLKHSTRKFRVLTQLGSFTTQHKQLSEEAILGIFEPWTNLNRKLMQRAIERGELPSGADIEMACQIIVSMTSTQTSLSKPFDQSFYATLLDNILLPGLKSARQS